MELTQIEKALYDKEAAILQAEIQRGAEIIRNAVMRYSNETTSYYGISKPSMRVTQEEVKELNQWIYKMGGSYYYGGDHLSLNSPVVSAAPEFIRKKVLSVAVTEFMAKFETIDEIRHIAEHAHQSTD